MRARSAVAGVTMLLVPGLLVPGLLLTGALAACGWSREDDAAARVDGERITVSRLQELTSELLAAGGDVGRQSRARLGAEAAQRKILSTWIASRIVARAAASKGVTVTPGEVDARYAELAAAHGGSHALQQALAERRNVPPSYARTYLRDLVRTEKLAALLVPDSGSDADTARQQRALNRLLVATGARMDVKVDPRYGTWNSHTGAITPLISGGLSGTEDELRPPAARRD